MKRKFALLLLHLIAWTFCVGAASVPQFLKINRIALHEKQNLKVQKLVSALMQVYGKGQLKAYQPLNIEKEFGYFNFLSNFGIPLPEYAYNPNVNPPCLECTLPELSNIGDLTYYLDYMEEPATEDGKEGKIKYVRIVLNKYGTTYFGPVFKYEDIMQANDEITIPNSRNVAAPYTFKFILENRLFTAHELINSDWDNTEEIEIKKPYEVWKDGEE